MSASTPSAPAASDAARWRCPECEWRYDEAQGDAAEGFTPGTRPADFPADWSCPDCGVRTTADLEREA